MYQHLYSRFLQANQGKQHFACHSHHYWPDVTRDAMLQYWDDTANMVDDKWDYLFGEKMPAVQGKIANILHTGQAQQIVFAPNTHELLFRIISCLDLRKANKILCTDSEFHSFTRQINRLNELANIELVVVPSLPFADFEQRFIAEIHSNDYELIFFSQVFFNSGLANRGFARIVEAVKNQDTIVVIDGYHGFMALPTDLSEIKDRAFYLAGSYKYAQGGEGCCFAHVPQGCQLRPLYTGWFAEFGSLDRAKTGELSYSTDGMRFAGSTMDFSPLYRLDAVLSLFEQQGIGVADTHSYVQSLQRQFLHKLDACQHPQLNRQHLIVHDLNYHGHFLTFKIDSAEQASTLAGYLQSKGIMVDLRGDRIRFGFAIYHNAEHYDLSCLAICPVWRPIRGNGCGD